MGIQEILQAGNTSETVENSGGWVGNGFKSYVDTEIDNAFKVQKMTLSLGGSRSGENKPPS